jgi:SAM-dependent methyltransferase
MSVIGFYDEFAPYYHLIYPDWDKSIARQAGHLKSIIDEFCENEAARVLDVACGIGTQSIGLAQLGFEVTASDVSPKEIERARREAAQRKLKIDFSVADMRSAFDHHQRTFDVVIACDNAIPHLLSDEDILKAFEQLYLCTAAGGCCIVSVRDYGAMELTGTQVKTHGLRQEGDTRYLVFQVWEFDGPIYELSMYVIEDKRHAGCAARVMRTKYYAVSTDKLTELMTAAGFQHVRRLDDRFFQPVLVGLRQ